MKKRISIGAFLCFVLVSGNVMGYSGLWQQVDYTKVPAKGTPYMSPRKYLVYSLTTAYLKQVLFTLSNNPNAGQIIELPMPDGTIRDFMVWQTPMMPDDLAAKYPNIKTFTAEAVGNHTITAKLDFTEFGFHAMIYNGSQTSFIDPYTREDQNYYIVHYKKDEQRAYNSRMQCLVNSTNHDELQQGEEMSLNNGTLPQLAAKTMNGYQLITYRLALSADHFYCQAASGFTTPTISQALSCMTTSMNRINGVYEREFSITMNFASKEDTLIWPVNTGSVNGNDPFNNIDANANACLNQNQTSCDTRIGSANYDVGHVFTTGGGGLSLLGVICSAGNKAKSVTGSSTPGGDGYDIDYVAHEMGHEYGSEHTFNNNNDGSCGGNAVNNYAYEPGSGSTIMAYAGICSPDDLQMHSDPYFVNSSLIQIYNKTIVGSGNSCAVKTNTNNKPVGIAAFTATYAIPYKTPFELIAPTAVDSVADTLTTYCWEQWNLGDFGKRLVNTYFKGPIFRSYNPTISATRVFPKNSMVLAGNLTNAGIEGAEGEKAPDTARFLTFKLTVRDIFQGNGCFLFPDDTIHLNVINTGAAFTVTSQNTLVSYTGGSTQTVTWNVVGTTSSPINAANVDIYFSTDGGNTWPTLIGTFPNNGSASVTVPNPATSTATARIKVKGSGNVFFNVNSHNFTVSHTVGISVEEMASQLKVYPVPAKNNLTIETGITKNMKLNIYNAIGQELWSGQINNKLNVGVNNWPKGIYLLQIADVETGNKISRSISVE